MRKWYWAIATALLVVAVGVVIVHASSSEPEAAASSDLVTTTPPPTTAAPPVETTTTTVDLALAQAFVEAWASSQTTTTTSPPPPPTTTTPPTTSPRPAPTSPPTSQAASPSGSSNIPAFLACVRQRESRGNYRAVNPSSGAGGAYQFMPTTWRNTALHAGRPDLAGIAPQNASPGDQDAMALHLLNWQGRSPWAGPGC